MTELDGTYFFPIKKPRLGKRGTMLGAYIAKSLRLYMSIRDLVLSPHLILKGERASRLPLQRFVNDSYYTASASKNRHTLVINMQEKSLTQQKKRLSPRNWKKEWKLERRWLRCRCRVVWCYPQLWITPHLYLSPSQLSKARPVRAYRKVAKQA